MISVSKQECCGCGACVAVCPHKAVAFKTDEFGFWYPSVNQKLCIGCGLCDSVCPSINPNEKKIEKSCAFGCKSINENIQLNSASGGFFPVVSNFILNSGGVVFGAAFSSDWSVEHIGVEGLSELQRVCRSKYVQSDCSKAFIQVKTFLQQDRLVLFTGTPCQCSALRKFLRRDYSNLYVIDIICHGVPSPMVWQRYLYEQSVLAETVVKDIEKIQFKYKDGNRYHWKHPGFFIRWKNGKELKVFSNQTGYENGFLSNLFIRPSCSECRVKSLSSNSDLTMGDFWGVENVSSVFFDSCGISLVFVNSEKGRNLFESVKNGLTVLPVSIIDAIRANKRIVEPARFHKRHIKFFKLLKTHSVDESVSLCLRMSVADILKSRFNTFKRKLKKLL